MGWDLSQRTERAALYDRVSAGVHADVNIDEAQALVLNTYSPLGEIMSVPVDSVRSSLKPREHYGQADEMTKKSDHLEVVDTTGLTDADWAEINKLKTAYDTGGQKALSAALDALATDPIQAARVLGALFPDLVRETIKDQLAEKGITEEDLRELIRKLDQSRH